MNMNCFSRKHPQNLVLLDVVEQELGLHKAHVMIPFKAFGTMTMARELKQHAEEISGVVFTSDEIFVSQKTSFIITENMEVKFASIVFTMKTLRGLSHKNLHNVEEMFVDVGHKEDQAKCFGC